MHISGNPSRKANKGAKRNFDEITAQYLNLMKNIKPLKQEVQQIANRRDATDQAQGILKTSSNQKPGSQKAVKWH